MVVRIRDTATVMSFQSSCGFFKPPGSVAKVAGNSHNHRSRQHTAARLAHICLVSWLLE